MSVGLMGKTFDVLKGQTPAVPVVETVSRIWTVEVTQTVQVEITR